MRIRNTGQHRFVCYAQDIRSCSARQSLRKTNAQRPIRSAFQENSRTQLSLDGESSSSQPPSARRLIEPDEKFSNDIFNFDMDDISPDSTQVS
jgi:hypothetical protein